MDIFKCKANPWTHESVWVDFDKRILFCPLHFIPSFLPVLSKLHFSSLLMISFCGEKFKIFSLKFYIRMKRGTLYSYLSIQCMIMHAYLQKNALDVPWIFRMKFTTKVKQLVLSPSLSYFSPFKKVGNHNNNVGWLYMNKPVLCLCLEQKLYYKYIHIHIFCHVSIVYPCGNVLRYIKAFLETLFRKIKLERERENPFFIMLTS